MKLVPKLVIVISFIARRDLYNGYMIWVHNILGRIKVKLPVNESCGLHAPWPRP